MELPVLKLWRRSCSLFLREAYRYIDYTNNTNNNADLTPYMMLPQLYTIKILLNSVRSQESLLKKFIV